MRSSPPPAAAVAMNEKNITMQSEVEELSSEATEDMTFTKKHDFLSSPPKPEPYEDEPTNFCDNPAKFEGINLDDDIEKVEVTSHESSDADEATAAKPLHQSFAGIPEQNPNESIKNWLQRITEMHTTIQRKTAVASSVSSSQTTTSTPSRIVKYQDLPYMGEMTLDNSKPRRGRKPKKADICHLIYKNYGTIFPGTPNASSYTEKDKKQEQKEDNLNKTNVQNKIISSLLEKRLTQEYKKGKIQREAQKVDQNEPLNLCIRDLNHLKIRFLKKQDNTYTTGDIKSEPQSEDEIEFVNETPSPSNEPRFPSVTPDSVSTPSPDIPKTGENTTAPGGYVYWPNAGVFIHPMALQQHLMMYQRLANNSTYTLPSHSPRPPPGDSKTEQPELRKLVPKTVRPKRQETEETEAAHDSKVKRNASCASDKVPTKRKRSAIFIPPIPAENNTNPATEVSICKFKFTGGAKPSLQEKKMLSVDSGGNFRYYSGTGDKSMRGYEFFPRETLQQQINMQGSSTGAFLQASGEKIYPVPPVEITGGQSSSDFLLSPEIPSTTLSNLPDSSKHKKRKSRKSLQREKLEQTFKEKGFLIQTQQLESAEGATYCKFRQLRKFTRYLFRSWKDYLPGNVRELQEEERNDGNEMESPEGTSGSPQSIGGANEARNFQQHT